MICIAKSAVYFAMFVSEIQKCIDVQKYCKGQAYEKKVNQTSCESRVIVVCDDGHRQKSDGAHETDCGAVSEPQGRRAAKHIRKV